MLSIYTFIAVLVLLKNAKVIVASNQSNLLKKEVGGGREPVYLLFYHKLERYSMHFLG